MKSQRMKWVSINGTSIRYELTGDGSKTLVLLHEMGGTLESWDEVVKSLPTNLRILRYDWRGMGLSQKIVGDVTLNDHSADLLGLLDHLRITEPVYLSGCAVGGAIALHFAAIHSSRAAGVLAMCPATEVAEEKKAINLASADRLDREGMVVVTGTGMAASYPEVVRKDAGLYQNYIAQYGGNDPRSFAATLRMLARQDINSQLRSIRCPVTVLAGKYDQGRPPATVKGVADIIPNAKFKVVESAHFMMIQTPDIVANELGEFLS